MIKGQIAQDNSIKILFILVSFFLAFTIMLLPFSLFFKIMQPDYLLVLVIYWSFTTPRYFGLISSWFVGLLTDVLLDVPLGLNAIFFLLNSYLIGALHARFSQYSTMQQAILVMLLIGFYRLAINIPYFNVSFFLPSNMLLNMTSVFLNLPLWIILIKVFHKNINSKIDVFQ